MRDLSLIRELRNLLLSVVPTRDIWCLADVHRAAGVDEGARNVVVARAQDEFLVHLRRSRLLTRDEPRANPHASGSVRERSGKAAAVGDPARRDNEDGLTSEGALDVLAEVDDCRNEDREGRLSGVPTAFAALGADDVDP